jgi:hypothetical protein
VSSADDEHGRGLDLLDGLIKLHGGARGATDDGVGRGKTIYVAVSIAARPICRSPRVPY